MHSIIYLYSHPIQYFAPLNRALAGTEGFELTVCYCSRQGLENATDPEFGVPVQWDLPLLDGYRAVFLPNWRSKGTPLSGFWSLVNPAIIKLLREAPRGYVVVHGWGYCTHLLAIFFGRLFGHSVCIRGESPLKRELSLPPFKRLLKKAVLQHLLFPLARYFFYIGNQNKAFYRFYGVPERKLVFTPYSVDNDRFQADARSIQGDKKGLRRSLGIPENARVVLYSGKFIEKKRPLDLLRAFRRVDVKDSFLVFLGEGELRAEMERYCREHRMKNVLLSGFVNQSSISRYYAAADIFVMCSGADETWGLSTNEAMNFSLPILLSDGAGCADDLCRPGLNGFVFQTGNTDALSRHLSDLLLAPESRLAEMGRASRELVSGYSFAEIIRHLKEAL